MDSGSTTGDPKSPARLRWSCGYTLLLSVDFSSTLSNKDDFRKIINASENYTRELRSRIQKAVLATEPTIISRQIIERHAVL